MSQLQYTGTGREMFIVFKSNNNGINGNGYLLTFKPVPNSGAGKDNSESLCNRGDNFIIAR